MNGRMNERVGGILRSKVAPRAITLKHKKTLHKKQNLLCPIPSCYVHKFMYMCDY